MGKRESTIRLILDSLLLVLCLVFFLLDVLITGDMILALVALGGVFVFSVRVGRDVRRRRMK